MIAVLALALASAVAPASAPERRFALVVGYNEPPREELPRLRYADDDAIRWAVMLRTFGADVELLAAVDDESRRLYGSGLPPTTGPTRADVESAMNRLRAGMQAAREAGAKVTFFFVYAGHGDVENGEGYVALAGGRLYRRDLENQVLGRSVAHANHVVIDACRAYYLAFDRGPGGTRRPWTRPYFGAGLAAKFPNTGFLLASSADAPTHEWEEFQSGVFSHEVRSGLLGGADADADARITYAEIATFVHVANRPVRNAKYRPSIVARSPSNGSDVLFDLGGATASIELDGAAKRRLLEDELGVRWADVHPAPGQRVALRLPEVPWSSNFFLRDTRAEHEYRFAARGAQRMSQLTPVPTSISRRGAAHEAFQRLFAQPFDFGARAEAMAAATAVDLHDTPRTTLRRQPLVGGLVLAGTIAGTAAGLLQVRAGGLREDALRPDVSMQRRATMNTEIRRLNFWTGGLTGASLTLLSTGLGIYLYDRWVGR